MITRASTVPTTLAACKNARSCVRKRTQLRAKVHAPCLRIFTFRALEGAQANLTEREYNTYRQPILDECMVMGSPCKDCLGRVGGGWGRLLVLREWGVRTAYGCGSSCTPCVTRGANEDEEELHPKTQEIAICRSVIFGAVSDGRC